MTQYDERGVSAHFCNQRKKKVQGVLFYYLCSSFVCKAKRRKRRFGVGNVLLESSGIIVETIRLEPEENGADWKSGAKSLGTDDLTKSPGVVWKSIPSLMSAFVKPAFFFLDCATVPTSKFLVSPGILQPGSHNAADNNTTSCFVPLSEDEPF